HSGAKRGIFIRFVIPQPPQAAEESAVEIPRSARDNKSKGRTVTVSSQSVHSLTCFPFNVTCWQNGSGRSLSVRLCCRIFSMIFGSSGSSPDFGSRGVNVFHVG